MLHLSPMPSQPNRFKVLYTDRGDYSHTFDIERPIYDTLGVEIVDARLDHNAIDWDACERYLATADALVCFRIPIHRRALDAAPKLKVAVRSGVGFENFDLEAFVERGIPACNVPDYGSEDVALHALSLMLALRRRIVFFDRSMRSGYWRGWPGELPVHRLSRQTVGIIGLGRIGQAFARQASPLFERMLACDPYIQPETFTQADTEPCSLEQLLSQADAVTIHTPLTP
jgi:D-3-phosphoglycerate dehydrogenase